MTSSVKKIIDTNITKACSSFLNKSIILDAHICSSIAACSTQDWDDVPYRIYLSAWNLKNRLYTTAISDLSVWEIYPVLDPKILYTWMDQSMAQRPFAGLSSYSWETNFALALSQIIYNWVMMLSNHSCKYP